MKQVKQYIKVISDDYHNLNDIFNDLNFSLVFMSLNFLFTNHLD
jgi:hypothetical protein